LTFNGLHGVISKEIELFVITVVRTPNPTKLKVDGRILYPIELLDLCSETPVIQKQQSEE
jgi:hypothetical protein